MQASVNPKAPFFDGCLNVQNLKQSLVGGGLKRSQESIPHTRIGSRGLSRPLESISGRKSAILLMPGWHRENSPEDLNADPKLGNCRLHPNLSQITVVCDYLQYKSVWHDFLKNPKFQYFRTGSSTKYWRKWEQNPEFLDFSKNRVRHFCIVDNRKPP